MTQLDAIKESQRPQTIQSLKVQFKEAGLKPGMNVIVHSSLSSIGWVCGGANSVIKAIMEVITWDGTLIMPTQSPSLSDPSIWENPSIPKSWWEEVKKNMPAFDCQITPTEFMGAIPEIFRTFPDVQRSYHPTHSFGIWGRNGRSWSLNHPLDESLSDFSPLGKLYENNGYIFLIGVGHDTSTSLHLAETMVYNFPKQKYASPILKQGKRVWEEYEDFQYDSEDFEKIGNAFEGEFKINEHFVGNAKTKFIPMKNIVDFAQEWITQNRKF